MCSSGGHPAHHRVGLPHSDILGSQPARGSPRPIAATPRPSSARTTKASTQRPVSRFLLALHADRHGGSSPVAHRPACDTRSCLTLLACQGSAQRFPPRVRMVPPPPRRVKGRCNGCGRGVKRPRRAPPLAVVRQAIALSRRHRRPLCAGKLISGPRKCSTLPVADGILAWIMAGFRRCETSAGKGTHRYGSVARPCGGWGWSSVSRREIANAAATVTFVCNGW